MKDAGVQNDFEAERELDAPVPWLCRSGVTDVYIVVNGGRARAVEAALPGQR